MSDTPIDRDLDRKRSVRRAEFLDARIEDFMESYNQEMQDALGEDAEPFLLESMSDAERRLLDIGLQHYDEHGLPFGFAVHPDVLDTDDAAGDEFRCPACGVEGSWQFRLGAAYTDDGVEFSKLRCLKCDTTTTAEAALAEPAPFFG